MRCQRPPALEVFLRVQCRKCFGKATDVKIKFTSIRYRLFLSGAMLRVTPPHQRYLTVSCRRRTLGQDTLKVGRKYESQSEFSIYPLQAFNKPGTNASFDSVQSINDKHWSILYLSKVRACGIASGEKLNILCCIYYLLAKFQKIVII